ncbi:unnamed protein product [Ceutorhynchus assimilis]|uniref:Uncharacterized protein n=1 Tax=Ceutorhynchus assimilis TaxID=467358 RepID=A0A9N9QNZ8_9CUCU|nr:unnamed protein product [Ceutorhynchus assimilis]
MTLSGKYKLIRDEGQYEHLIANGMPEDRAKAFIEGGMSYEILISGNDVTLVGSNGRTQKYVLGQETTQTTPDGKIMKNTASLDANILTVETKFEKGTMKRVFSLSGSELIVLSVSDKPGIPDGKRIYEKV